ncbi:hypothetical protein DMUE_0393 [Dictyocoela muelleri]|nr:hypothetical protein DMUE_0393 [Dictyocoela muelleri]
MSDIYSKIQKQKTKPKKQDETDKLIEEKCKQLEQENQSIAKSAREKLEKTAEKQKSITSELKQQGEQLVNAEKSGKKVHKNVRKGAETTEKIKDEGHMFRMPFVSSLKRIFKREKGEDELIKDNIDRNRSHEHLHQDRKDTSDSDDSSLAIEKGSQLKKGNEKTDEELKTIYKTLKGMKKENLKQQDEMDKQKSVTKNLDSLNKDSNAILSRTNKELKKL